MDRLSSCGRNNRAYEKRASTMIISYINTDLDVEGEVELIHLATAFETRGMHHLHVERRENGRWHARCETDTQYGEVDGNISAMLDSIESLRGSAV